MIKRIIRLLFMIIVVIWVGIIIYDAMNSKEGEPKFCLSKETKNYSDGTVDICNGLGYKVYKYKRGQYEGIEFGPFWTKEKSEEQINDEINKKM